MSEFNYNQQQQQQQQHQTSDDVPTSSVSAVAIEAAPYPPMNANYYNNIRAPSKSSLSTSPHYTTTYGRASSMSTSLVGEHIVTTNATTPSLSSTVTSTGGGGYSLGELTTIAAAPDDDSKIHNNRNNNNSNSSAGVGGVVGGGGGVAALSSQIMFCPDLLHDDIVATINCVSHSSSSTTTTTTTNNKTTYNAYGYGYGSGSGSGDSSISVGGKQRGGGNKMSSTNGPIMMELRRVELKRNRNGDDDDDDDDDDDNGGSGRGNDEFFTTRTVAVSRGLPSLGISVASTCLDLASSTIVNNYDSSGNTLMAATGSTTGALCIHKFNTIEKTTATIVCDDYDDSDDIEMDNNNKTSSSLAKSGGNGDYDDEDLFSASPIEYFHTPRHHRKASAVAWRTAVQTNHVAIGLVGTNTTVSGGTKNQHSNHHHHNRRGGPISMRASASDREYCCFLWDIVDNKRTTMPLSKFAYNSPVASLAWMMDGQTLAVGGQQRTIQLYDLRMLTDDSNKLPPLSAHAHESGVHGIEVHPFRPNIMATFCRAVGEPVKLFDIRRMDSVVSEIRLTSNDINTSGTAGSSTSNTALGTMSMQRKQQTKAEAIQWSMLESGMLSVATGESVQEYDTNSGSRPNLVRVNRVSKAGKTIKAIALYRGKGRKAAQPNDGSVVIDGDNSNSNTVMVQERKEGEVNIIDDSQKDCNRSDRLLSLLYPQRMLAVLEDQTIVDMAKDTNAPLAISRRDGRLVHALGPHLFMGKSSEGPSAMEKNSCRMQQDDEDISATMMRRARCLQKNPYSMDPELNIKLMSREIESDEDIDGYRSSLLPKYSNHALLRLWSWIERVESLSFQEVDDTNEDLRMAKGLLNTGIIQILGMNTQNYDGNDKIDEQTMFSETFACNIYDSPARRVALSMCGWAGKFELTMVMAECEALGEHERSAALAVWHEDVGAAVEALQRASESIRLQSRETDGGSTALAASLQYAETLDLISMCIAGYGGKTESQRGVWRRACSSLLLRDDLSLTKAKHSRVAYLRALCEFLMNAGTIESLVKILENSQLSLCDRVAFSCRFLEKKELMTYLLRCVEICQHEGDLEGLAITSLSKPGIKILQSFVDQYTDVQTAALVVSRVILPSDWAIERKICFEWVESYRSLLNYWQMWQTRAMFDVDRAEVLRRVKARSGGGGSNQRRLPNPRMRQSPRPPDPDILPCIPAQLEARCNYCSSPLSLKRNEGITNQWLSKMQPLLNCCPQCRKPLPRCSICLLSMGSLNPYMELTRARQKGTNAASADDLSSLSSMNFAEWYTWCMR
jgi:hypothetical protein